MNTTKYLRTHDAARYCGLSHRTLEKLRITGGGPAYLRPTARCVVYAVDDLDMWLLRDRRRSTSDPGAASDGAASATVPT